MKDGWHRRLITCLGFGLILACLCNGAGFYLKKIGALNHEEYQAYWVIHCTGAVPTSAIAPDPCAGKDDASQQRSKQISLEAEYVAHLHKANGAELALKLAKDVLSLALLSLSVALIATRRVAFPDLRANAPAVVLLTLVFAGSIHSWLTQDGLLALLGFRSLAFLAIALTAGWLARDLHEFAKYVCGLLALQVLLLPIEFAWGMHIHGHFPGTIWPIRLSGTFVFPNTLGVFAVIALAFVHAFASTVRRMPWLHCIVAILVLVSGSATGWITLILFWGLLALLKIKRQSRLRWSVVLMAVVLLTVLCLPALVGRQDLFNSVFGGGGRLEGLIAVARSGTIIQLLWGSGLGSVTNTATSAFINGLTPLAGTVVPEIFGAGDSTVTSLLAQLGLTGVVAFYGMLAVAAWQHRRTRIFFLVVTISSLTINIPELYPANILLGMALVAQTANAAA